MAQRPPEISSPVKPVSSPGSHGVPVYKGYLRVGRNIHAVSWEQAGNHQRRQSRAEPATLNSLKSCMKGFFGADLGHPRMDTHHEVL